MIPDRFYLIFKNICIKNIFYHIHNRKASSIRKCVLFELIVPVVSERIGHKPWTWISISRELQAIQNMLIFLTDLCFNRLLWSDRPCEARLNSFVNDVPCDTVDYHELTWLFKRFSIFTFMEMTWACSWSAKLAGHLMILLDTCFFVVFFFFN